MKTFDKIRFKWTFRDYQQKVLDNSTEHLSDRKIHIVAAPGSGKTVLGLELIRRLRAPALVLSPSVSIKQQWGDRFIECYLPENESYEEYVSYDLKSPSLITSVTYQALHAAMNKITLNNVQDEDEFESEKDEDFTDFDLVLQIKNHGIKTLCLDEAHHLKSEWQKALEKFIDILGSDFTIISLTATPPYDSDTNEWNRYSSLCGEIDEEIFVPQLVKQKTLCPHQDYICFSYPTEDEEEILKNYKKKAEDCTKLLLNEGYMTAALRSSGIIGEKRITDEVLYNNINGFTALIITAYANKAVIPEEIIRKIFGRKSVPACSTQTVQSAFQFVIDNPEIFGDSISEDMRNILLENSLIEKRKVQLITNDKLDRMLASSMGKLSSIERIVESEANNLGENLRMLILTDFIKKEIRKSIGKNDDIHTMGAVPVFEAIRRKAGETVKIAMLTGSLVILPDSAIGFTQAVANDNETNCIVKPIEGTGHCEVIFSGSNKHKVSIITKVFAQGYINVLVGTKSLLGEGWDSPNINSLILASFVGSFMLSNQMRGRAIRIDKNNPQKVSNIWHLVTCLPEDYKSSESEIGGNDYETVKRRFACFQAPAYNSDVIESGIKRIDILVPPFNASGIDRINNQMFSLAAERNNVEMRWNGAVKGKGHPDISDASEVPVEVYPKAKVSTNKILAIIFALIAVIGIIILFASDGIIMKLAGIGISIFSLVFFFKRLSFVTKNSSPEKTVLGLSGAVLKTLQKLREIDDNPKIKVRVLRSKDNKSLAVSLTDGTEREKKVFIKAINEMFSPIDEPRYVIIGLTKLFGSYKRNYTNSFSCPSVIGVNKENAEILKQNLKSPAGNFELVFTKSENGRKVLNECKKLSLFNSIK